MSETWHIGSKVSWNVYGKPTKKWPDGRPVCQCHNAEDAARIVEAVNGAKCPTCNGTRKYGGQNCPECNL